MLHKRNHISKPNQLESRESTPENLSCITFLEQRQYETEFGRAAQNPYSINLNNLTDPGQPPSK